VNGTSYIVGAIVTLFYIEPYQLLVKGIQRSVQDHVRQSDSVLCSVCKWFVVTDKENKHSGVFYLICTKHKVPIL